MDIDIEVIKDKIRTYLNKKDINLETQYFLFTILGDEIKNEILYEDETEDFDLDNGLDNETETEEDTKGYENNNKQPKLKLSKQPLKIKK